MKQDIEQAVAAAVKELYGVDVTVELTRPDEQFGDYATNVALQLAGKLHKQPRDIADALAGKIRQTTGGKVAHVAVAGPGFLNITLSDDAIATVAASAATFRSSRYKDKVVVSDYSDPNVFKALHVGHLYTTIVGDAIMNLVEHSGAVPHRTNYGSDVGLPAARAMWGIIHFIGGESPDSLPHIQPAQQADWLSERYVEGTEADETNPQAKQEIIGINKKIYALHAQDDHESPFAQLYWTCRQWSYDYFDNFYARIGSHFEKYYPESSIAQLGLDTVREQLKRGVYKESDGAVIFDGEPYGLHARVFINSQGLPTYEAKDVGLIMAKWRDYHFNKSIIVTGGDIAEYMKVVLKSIEQFAPDLAAATWHITHGNVKMAGGVKMSSRKGNVLLAVDVLDTVAEVSEKQTGKSSEQTTLGAIKYAFLKQRIGQDIIYDPAESVSLEGNSGPYLQYAHARARSILSKSKAESATIGQLEAGERSLVRKISEYPEVVEKATTELLPHYICTYLYELAQAFNSFYEHNRVLGNDREGTRLALVRHYADTLKAGLELLGIAAPEKM